MDGANITYKSVFGNLWGFFLGRGDSLQRIDAPGKWEDLLFAFSRNDVTATVREELSYTLWFRGSGARVLRGRITGPRGTAPLVLEIRKWSPLKAQWSVYYRGTVDDTTIIVHADYTEASTKPVGVSQDLIDKADKEYTVTLAGKRIEIPRMWPVEPLYNKPEYALDPQPTYPLFNEGKRQLPVSIGMADNTFSLPGPSHDTKWGANLDPSDTRCLPRLVLSYTGSGYPQPFIAPSAVDGVCIVAQSGTYRITNDIQLKLAVYGYGTSSDDAFSWRRVPTAYTKGVVYGRTPREIAEVPANQTFVIIGEEKIPGGQTREVVLTKGDTIKVCTCDTKGNPVAIEGLYQPSEFPLTGFNTLTGCLYQFAQGSITIVPVDVRTPLSAPAVRDIDLFAQLCRQVTRRADLAFDFDRYRPAYFSNPDGSQAAVFLLSLSRLKESVVQNGTAAVQGSGEAYFKGLTLRQFYKYFLAQGYKVAVEQRADRDGNFYPAVVVAPYCNSQRQSYYFPRDPATIVDLGTAVTDLELARYAHTFTRVAAGSDPDDFGAYPREEGYQDPCNRRITYAIDGSAGDGDDPYEIELPWPVTTLGLEEALRTFEGENDEARDKRWTEGEGIHLVCGSADTEGQIASITQYDPIPGQFYRPLNLGFRPESLVRRNIPLLCMALDPYDMEDTFFVPESVEGDDIPVASAGGWNTGDAFLDPYTTGDPVRETYQNPDDTQDSNPRGIVRPVMVTLRSATDRNIYALLHEEATRYGVVRFRHRGKEVAGYLRSVELNPTELSVQKWELLPVWGQDLSFINP